MRAPTSRARSAALGQDGVATCRSVAGAGSILPLGLGAEPLVCSAFHLSRAGRSSSHPCRASNRSASASASVITCSIPSLLIPECQQLADKLGIAAIAFAVATLMDELTDFGDRKRPE